MLKAVKLCKSNEIEERIEKLYKILEKCTLCPRRCGVNRLKGETGFCNATSEVVIGSIFPHFGEERELVGRYGSGTIFLTYCNLKCIFCQNYELSHLGEGRTFSTSEIAKYMLRLQEEGCHNINFVTPTHYVPQLVKAIKEAVELGLEIPIVYNCGGYESEEVIDLLDGIIDIYMPDAKFWNPSSSEKYCKAPDYPEVMRKILKKMHSQVGDLKVNSYNIAESGLLIRHLVMPNLISETKEILKFIAEEIGKNTYVNIMAQYRPCFKAYQFPEISRRITFSEYKEAIEFARSLGLKRGFEIL